MRGALRTLASSIVALGLAAPLAGCGFGNIRNVRAFRTYANEDANIAVSVDRVEDIAEALTMVDRLLTKTPYSPGDTWVKHLALTDAEAERIRTTVKEAPPYAAGDHQVPIVKLYRLHLAAVLAEAQAAHASEEAKYPSVIEAMATLSSSSGGLADEWKALEKARKAHEDAVAAKDKLAEELAKSGALRTNAPDPPELVAARKAAREAEKEHEAAQQKVQRTVLGLVSAKDVSGDRAKIARDALEVSSVALRVDLEALALIPIVIIQTSRSLPSAPRDLLAQKSLKAISQITELPAYAERIEDQLGTQLKLARDMSESLAALTKEDLSHAAGFALRESVVDQVVGVTLDSFRVNAKLGGEAMFFVFDADKNQSTSTSTTTDSNGNQTSKTTSTDYTGRAHRLLYDVSPIYFFGGRINAGFDFFHMPNAANLNLGFASDFGISSGGTIDNDQTLGQALGLHGAASQLFNAGLGILGVKSDVKVAQFTAGQVQYMGVSTTTGNDLVNGKNPITPFQLGYTQVDVGYDTSFLFPETAGRYYIEELRAGFRFMNYKMPRILYEMRDTSTDPNNESWVFERESPPQVVDSKYYMGGLLLRMGPGGAPLFSVFMDLGVYLGAGPTQYYFIRGNSTPTLKEDVEKKRDYYAASVFAVNGSGGFGMRLRLSPKKWRVRIAADAQYRGEFIYSHITTQAEDTSGTGSSSTKTGGKKVVFGGADIYHGPRLDLQLSF